jgi:Preprotein translocase subunit YidC
MNAVTTDESQAKQMQFMNKFMIVFISFASFGLPTAIAFYWIVSNGFTVIQNIILKNKMKAGGSKWKNINLKVKPKKV